MSMEERRLELMRILEEAFGTEGAARLMEHIPPDRWTELARNEDVLALREDVRELQRDVGELQRDVGELQRDVGGLQRDVAELRRDMDEARQERAKLRQDIREIRHDFDSLRGWLDQQFALVEERREATEHRILGCIRSEMAGLVSSQTRTIVIALVAAITANSGLVLAAARLT